MFDAMVLVWIGYIAVAIMVGMMLFIFRTKREGKVYVIREEGEVILPCTEDRFGNDLTPPKEVRKCKKCGKPIRNDRWFCSMKCKRAYLKRRA